MVALVVTATSAMPKPAQERAPLPRMKGGGDKPPSLPGETVSRFKQMSAEVPRGTGERRRSWRQKVLTKMREKGLGKGRGTNRGLEPCIQKGSGFAPVPGRMEVAVGLPRAVWTVLHYASEFDCIKVGTSFPYHPVPFAPHCE
eukprot:2147840-Amphidinium_carterae.3